MSVPRGIMQETAAATARAQEFLTEALRPASPDGNGVLNVVWHEQRAGNTRYSLEVWRTADGRPRHTATLNVPVSRVWGGYRLLSRDHGPPQLTLPSTTDPTELVRSLARLCGHPLRATGTVHGVVAP